MSQRKYLNPSVATPTSASQLLDREQYLELTLEARRQERDAIAFERDQLRDELATVYASTSWRITSPLRRTTKIDRHLPRHRLTTAIKRARQFADNTLVDRLLGAIFATRRPSIPPNQASDYEQWIAVNDTLTDTDRGIIKDYLNTLRTSPTISIVIPVFNPPIHHLRKTIESVINQLYKDWQLCIVDDASTDPAVRACLEEYQLRDSRIVVRFRPCNGGITEAANDAIEVTVGDFVALLDQGDLLRDHALAWIVGTIAQQPNLALIYSDEDKFDQDGHRHDPYFKPDWNPELLLAQNYLAHLVVFERSRLVRIGGFRSGFEGALNWDLVLRFTQDLDPTRIGHIPTVLYHALMLPKTTAIAVNENTLVVEAGRRAVREALAHSGITATLEPVGDDGAFNLVHPLPSAHPLVSILIPTHNQTRLLQGCIDSLGTTTYPNYEVIVINNRCDDPDTISYLAEIAQRDHHRVLDYPHPFNYAAMHNWALEQVSGEYVVLLNDDTEVISHDWLSDMVGFGIQPGVGAVGALLFYEDDTIQHAGVVLGVQAEAGHLYKLHPATATGHHGRALVAQSITAVTGACLLISREAWREVGGMAPELAINLNDLDLCLRLISAGYRNIWTPGAKLYHYESKSRGADLTPSQRERYGSEIVYFRYHWTHFIIHDPAYNPNLTQADLDGWLAPASRTVAPWLPRTESIELPCPYPERYFPIGGITLSSTNSVDVTITPPPSTPGRITSIRFACQAVIEPGTSASVLVHRINSTTGAVEETLTAAATHDGFEVPWTTPDIQDATQHQTLHLRLETPKDNSIPMALTVINPEPKHATMAQIRLTCTG
ncbi:MAG: glycosyltransferase family 2 protein [Ferrimicrobium sp.]